MQGSWVSSPNISSGPMPLPGYDSRGNQIPTPFGDYDTRGNYIGVPLRNYDRGGNELLSTRPIVPDPPAFTNYFEEKKRKEDFDNNFKIPEPFIPKINPIPEIKIKAFEPIKIEPLPSFDFDSFNKPAKSKKSYDPFGINSF